MPLCTPTRVSLMTGKYNFRIYLGFWLMKPDETALFRRVFCAMRRRHLGRWRRMWWPAPPVGPLPLSDTHHGLDRDPADACQHEDDHQSHHDGQRPESQRDPEPVDLADRGWHRPQPVPGVA